jgi:hypothetical protein
MAGLLKPELLKTGAVVGYGSGHGRSNRVAVDVAR